MSDRDPRIYVLPNLMTAGNLLCGFMAILHIVGRFQPDLEHQRYHWAIGFILAACVFDALDGRLARPLTGASRRIAPDAAARRTQRSPVQGDA